MRARLALNGLTIFIVDYGGVYMKKASPANQFGWLYRDLASVKVCFHENRASPLYLGLTVFNRDLG